MNDLESELRGLPLIAASPDLDRRVLSQKPEPSLPPAPAPWRVPVWAAAMAALAMAVAGFGAGFAWRAPQGVAAPLRAAPTTVQIIYHSASTGDPFDFTRASSVFPAGDLEAKVYVERGASL